MKLEYFEVKVDDSLLAPETRGWKFGSSERGRVDNEMGVKVIEHVE